MIKVSCARPRALLATLLTAVWACGGEVAVNSPAPASITVERLSDRIRIHSGAATAEIQLARYRLSLLGTADTTPVASEGAQGGVF